VLQYTAGAKFRFANLHGRWTDGVREKNSAASAVTGGTRDGGQEAGCADL
jgi:hypothetical protein